MSDHRHEHEPVWSIWYLDPVTDLWRRDCTIKGCGWRQLSSEEPGKETPLGRALGRAMGIE